MHYSQNHCQSNLGMLEVIIYCNAWLFYESNITDPQVKYLTDYSFQVYQSIFSDLLKNLDSLLVLSDRVFIKF